MTLPDGWADERTRVTGDQKFSIEDAYSRAKSGNWDDVRVMWHEDSSFAQECARYKKKDIRLDILAPSGIFWRRARLPRPHPVGRHDLLLVARRTEPRSCRSRPRS